MKKVILYVHGKGGNYLEAEQYKKNCQGFDIVGIDYNEYLPWLARKQFQAEYDRLSCEYDSIVVIANSIGAYLTMYSLQKCKIEKALFISPTLDMERLILDVMQWANVTEEELQERKEIQTDFDETLSWEYLTFVRENPINWNVFTEILYASKDNLTSFDTVKTFVGTHNARLTVMENGEHWFHTKEQLAFLDEWMKNVI